MEVDFTKVRIKGQLKNITENKTDQFTTTAISNKNKITYKINNDKYKLKIINNKKIILERITNEVNCIFYFDLLKETTTLYKILALDLNLEIKIITTQITLTDKLINIKYRVKDSNNEYEYICTRSD